MFLVHLHLIRDGTSAPDENDARLLHDALRALVPADAGFEHIRARAGPGGIDLSIFLRRHLADPDPEVHARAILDSLPRTPSALGGWHVRPAR